MALDLEMVLRLPSFVFGFLGATARLPWIVVPEKGWVSLLYGAEIVEESEASSIGWCAA